MHSLFIGMDIGSTTVKAIVVDPENDAILWKSCSRHHARQAQLALKFLQQIRKAFAEVREQDFRVFITGSGASPIAPLIGARFIQEVNAVTLAVEKLYPEAGSVIEIGGQDAKIILFKTCPETGRRQSIASMNDKCASGTGAIIDKCLLKLGISGKEAELLQFNPDKLHHVAAKCGVFAETDIVNLLKSGVPSAEILCSLADAIVMQNMSVLVRGNTLRDKVILLGGPNKYFGFLRRCWQYRIPENWRLRGYDYDQLRPIEELISAPDNAELFAAYGAVLFGRNEPDSVGAYRGEKALARYIEHECSSRLQDCSGPPLLADDHPDEKWLAQYATPIFTPAPMLPGKRMQGYLGLDGGSTSSKCVLLDRDGEVLLKQYRLSGGNPLEDMKEMLRAMHEKANQQQASLDILGFGVTGYAGDILEMALLADVNIVETVAHMRSASHYFNQVDVICDIGGQDIKVLMLRHGEMKNYRLSNQCSAGNGMLLQAMADQFGVPVEKYAEYAFRAKLTPNFSYGCAVFLDSDRVNFQREGYNKEELMAGLAMALPKNIWQYVVQIPRMAALGERFVLQGGVQKNLAAVKAQVDYIQQRVPKAEIMIHPHCGEAGAIGAALEARRVVEHRGLSTFIGLEAAVNMSYSTRTDQSTRCNFCPNACTRTFIDTFTPNDVNVRCISGFSCDKGAVAGNAALKEMESERRSLMLRHPNLITEEAQLCFSHDYDPPAMPAAGSRISAAASRRFWRRKGEHCFQRSSESAWKRRRRIRIAMPRVLNMWSTAPFWRAYLETLGIPKRHIIFSDNTSEAMFAEGGKYGSTDPCFPAKAVQAHIHNILFHKHHERRPIDYLFFPAITHVPPFLESTMDDACCPVVAGAPSVIKAAFTHETDFFAQRGIQYIDDAFTMNEPNLLKSQLFQCWRDKLGITEHESDFAVDQAWLALGEFDKSMQRRGRELIMSLEQTGGVGVLLLARPYHNDPGINHQITEELQAMGFPVLSIRSIPKDPAWLQPYFDYDLNNNVVDSALSINDVWPENYSANSAQKVWAAKFAARHPNLAVLELSSFKCGNDAPIYSLIENIVAASGTPFATLHDIDANKPASSIKIRLKTYAHSLSLHRKRVSEQQHNEAERQLPSIRMQPQSSGHRRKTCSVTAQEKISQ
jgi:predicted CoA-substrate-specific enzyme activase